jgi:hypothetical protein
VGNDSARVFIEVAGPPAAVDELVRRLRSEAPPLARVLYTHCELDREVPARLFAAVAQVLGFVYQLRRWRREGGSPPPPLAPIDIDETQTRDP